MGYLLIDLPSSGVYAHFRVWSTAHDRSEIIFLQVTENWNRVLLVAFVRETTLSTPSGWENGLNLGVAGAHRPTSWFHLRTNECSLTEVVTYSPAEWRRVQWARRTTGAATENRSRRSSSWQTTTFDNTVLSMYKLSLNLVSWLILYQRTVTFCRNNTNYKSE